MKKIAVIDVGSNSVRLILVADGKVLYKTLEITRLGEFSFFANHWCRCAFFAHIASRFSQKINMMK